MDKQPRTHNPAWQDRTRKERAAKRQTQDDAWATLISGGRYPTLRKLMTAIHNGEFELLKPSGLFHEIRKRARTAHAISLTSDILDEIAKEMKS
jgi:hypothetical protein